MRAVDKTWFTRGGKLLEVTRVRITEERRRAPEFLTLMERMKRNAGSSPMTLGNMRHRRGIV
jgi:hypothetical protein